MNVLRRFNLVLVLEFVEDEMWALEEAFGWSSPRKQVRDLLPKRAHARVGAMHFGATFGRNVVHGCPSGSTQKEHEV